MSVLFLCWLAPPVTAQQQREFLPVTWELAWQVPPTLDSFLLMPGSLTADRDGFIMFDFGDSSVKRIGPDGELDWSSGRSGPGPGEFRGTRWLAVHGDTVWHTGDHVVTVLSTAGKFARTFRAPGLERAVPLGEGGLGLMAQGPLLRRIDGAGQTVREWSPAGFLDELVSMEREAFPSSESDAGTLLVAFVRSGKLALLSREPDGRFSGRILDGVEPFNFGRIVSMRHESGVVVRRIDPRVPEGAFDVSQSDRYFHVFFMGGTPDAGRIVDLYAPDGTYAGSLRLPEGDIRSIAVTSDGAIGAIINEPAPHLKVWRWTLEGR